MRYPKTEPVLASFWQSHHQADILISFAACIQFSADGAGISFAEKSRKPPFSLGLQSLLELLLHKIGVPRVNHRVHETDAVSQKQLDKTTVHGMHAVRSSDLNQSRYLRKPPVPNTRLDSRVHRQQFCSQNQAGLVASRQEILAHHSQQ